MLVVERIHNESTQMESGPIDVVLSHQALQAAVMSSFHDVGYPAAQSTWPSTMQTHVSVYSFVR